MRGIDYLISVAVLVLVGTALLWPVTAHSGPSPFTADLSGHKQIAVAYLIYAGDHDDRLPLGDETPVQFAAMGQILKRDRITSHNPLDPVVEANVLLAGRKIDSEPDPALRLLVFGRSDWPKGRRCAAFLDGHAWAASTTAFESAWTRPFTKAAP